MRTLTSFWRETRGAAAAEFVMWVTILALPVLNVVDLGMYVFQKMQLQMAAQAATHAVWKSCDKSAKLPAVANCTGLAATIQAAAQSTTLGSKVTVVAGSPTEGYYCVDGAGALQLVGTAGKIGTTPVKPSPFNCATKIASSTTVPGDYVQVTVSYPYQPVFTAVSVANLLTTPITKTSWMRLN